MNPSVFIVEDDADIARLLQHHLAAEGYFVRCFSGASGVLREGESARPDLFLLDIMIPDGDGFDLCRRIRKSPALARIPVIFVTAKTAEADRIHGFDLGADDYVTKPFSPREVVARVRAVLRRFESPLSASVLRAHDLEINTDAMTVTHAGVLVSLTATEFRLLEYMARNAGKVFSREQLLDAVWKDTRFVTPRSVDVYVRRLREKLEPEPDEPLYLKTIRGAGYRFEMPN